MSATTQVSSGTALASGPTLSLTGAGEQKPLRPLTRDEAVGFEVDSPDTWSNFHKRVHKLKPQGDYDVDMKILACGVCGSDVHTLCGGWGDQHYPLCVGHGEPLPLLLLLPTTSPGPPSYLHRYTVKPSSPVQILTAVPLQKSSAS